MDEPFISQKTFVIIFLLLTVIAVSGGALLKFNGNNTTASPSPSSSTDNLNFFGSTKPNEQNTGLTQPQNPNSNPSKRRYSQFPGVLPPVQLNQKKAVIETSKGNIEFEIFGEEAPKTASNFIFLANDRFYDGLTFHRVEPGFVIQGGDPLGNGTGGPGYKFEDEPVKRKYDKGIVAMANSGPNTNGSQFFIMLEDNASLPPNYTIFGKVLSGMDTVSKIEKGDVMKTVSIQSL